MEKSITTIKNMKNQIMYILLPKQKKQCVGICILIFIGSIFEMLGVTAVLPFIQAVLEPQQIRNNKYLSSIFEILKVSSDFQIILFVGLLLILIYIIKNIYLLFSSYIQIRFKLRLQKDLSVLMLRTYMRRPYTFFLDVNSGDILRGINNDVYGVYALLENCFRILTEGITTILIAIFIIVTDPIMAIGVIFIASICFFSIVLGMRKKMKVMGVRQREVLAKQNKYAYQAINGIKEITVMQRNEDFIKQYEEAYEIKRSTDVAYYFTQAIPERMIEGICISGIIGIVCFRVLLGVEITTFIPQLAAFAVAAFRILPSVSRLIGYFSGIVFYRPTLEAAYENIKAAREYEEYLRIYALDRNVVSDGYNEHEFKKELIVNNIEWRYNNSAKKILSNLYLKIEKGEAIALIGASGSGKTTLVDVILGLLQPQSGSVYMDGIDIFAIKKDWAKIIGYVPQNVYLLDDTIRNNVAFGVSEQEIDNQKVWDALEKAQLKQHVIELPEQLDTIVGERGVKFSGGQRQRVAIARALYCNPDILVLDEATSALDNDTETIVMETINALQGDKTLIIVAHRLSTIKKCDKIYEIKDGKAVLRDNLNLHT